MENMRKYERYPIQREAQYFLNEERGKGQECTINNFSRGGMGIIFHSSEEINAGTLIRLEIPVSISSEPIHTKGVLKWFENNENNFIGGLELTEMLSDVKFSKLG
jgi:hypothetical protein